MCAEHAYQKQNDNKKKIFRSSTPHDSSLIRMRDSLQVEAGTYSRLDLDTRELGEAIAHYIDRGERRGEKKEQEERNFKKKIYMRSPVGERVVWRGSRVCSVLCGTNAIGCPRCPEVESVLKCRSLCAPALPA